MRHPHGDYFLIVLIIATAVVAVLIALPFLKPLALAAVFAVVLQPVYAAVSRGLKDLPSIAALLTVLFSIFVILAPLTLVTQQIVVQATDVYASLSGGQGKALLLNAIRDVEAVADRYVPGAGSFSEGLSQDLSSYAQSAMQWIIQHSGAAVASVAATLLSTFVFMIALYYLLKDGAHFREILIRFSPLRDAYDKQIFERLHTAVNSVVRGSLLIALLQGFASTIGFAIFGVPNAILWGAVAALGALLPGVGTGIVFAPVVAFLYFSGNTFAAVGLGIWGITAVGLVDNFLTPTLIGSGIKLHPLLVLVSVLGGIMFFGPLGIFLGPLTLSLLFALLTIYSDLHNPHQRRDA